MSRPLRIEFEGAFYHVISRGERREKVFHCNRDKQKFLEKLGQTAEKYSLRIFAYVLMENHYHLLVETTAANLGKAMHGLNSSYGNWFRCKYQLAGSVFQGRYKAILVEKEDYIKTLSAYIHLNPVRAGIVSRPAMFRFSSYSCYCGGKAVPSFLCMDVLLEMCGGRDEYRNFVESLRDAGARIEPEEIYGKNSMLGSENFLRQAFDHLKARGAVIDKCEHPVGRSAALTGMDDVLEVLIADMRIPEEEIWKRKHNNIYRKLLVHALWRHTACSLDEIGSVLGMKYSAVSALARRFERDLQCDKALQRIARRLEKGVRMRKLIPE